MRRSLGVALVAIGVVVAALAWLSPRWSWAVLTSDSMEPWASPGDLLLHRHVPVEDIRVGDVVTVEGARDRLVTHRVVRLGGSGTSRIARLQGDRSRLPDPLPVDLQGDVARVAAVVPRMGDALLVGGPLLLGAVVLLAAGGGALALARRREGGDVAAAAHEAVTADRGGTAAPADAQRAAPAAPSPDPRLEALLATCEQLAEDGVPQVVLADVVRVRAAALAGLPSAERAGAVLSLDDGARFYVVACADADAAALALVPAGCRRQRAATAALDQWWDAVADQLPATTAAALASWPPDE